MDKENESMSLAERLMEKKVNNKKVNSYNNKEIDKKRDFFELYNELYRKNKHYLNQLRKREVKRNNKIVSAIILFLIIMLLAYFFNELFFQIIAFTILFSMIPAIIIITVLRFKRRFSTNKKVTFDKEFKERIVRPIIQNLLPNSNIVFEYGLSSKVYEYCSHEEYDTYSSSNYIESAIKISDDTNFDTTLHICNVKTKKEIKNGEDTRLKTVFDGMLATLELPKKFNGELRVLRNNSIYNNSVHKLEMDMGEFEKTFDIHTNNKINTMQWLTSDTMSEILNLLNKYNFNIEFCIVDNLLVIRFFIKNEIENMLIGNQLYLDRVKTYIKQLEKVIEITSYIVKSYNEVEL